MGVHHAPHSSSSHAARLAGRGALTAAAALALTGGTASLAFASAAPSVPTTHDIQGEAAHGAHELQDAAKASPSTAAPHLSAHDVSGSVTGHAATARSAATHAASTLPKAHSLPTSVPSLPASATSVPSSVPSAPTSVPIAAMKTDAGHFADNAKADLQHAATNWSGAAKGGLTAHEASDQLGLMSTDASHAVANGTADASHWSKAVTGSAPQLSMLSFT